MDIKSWKIMLAVDDNLTDAERIQIDMMSKNGSSMDVMA